AYVTKLSRKTESQLKEALNDPKYEVRFAAAWLIGSKKLPLQQELIPLLTDNNQYVRQAARRSLVLLGYYAKKNQKPAPTTASKSKPKEPALVDFGPLPNAPKPAQTEAAQKWTEWWAKLDEASGKKKPGSSSSSEIKTSIDN